MISEELALRLGLKTEGFDQGLQSSTQRAVEFGDKLGKRLGDKLYGLRDVSHAVATALGLNLENISENVARAISGISKAQEEAYKQVVELGAQTADIYDKIFERRRTDEQNIALLKEHQNRLNQESATIVAEIAERTAKLAAAEKDESLSMHEVGKIREAAAVTADEQVRLAQINKALAADQLSIAEKQAAVDGKTAAQKVEALKAIAESEKQAATIAQKNDLDQMGSLEKITELKRREAELQQQINDEETSDIEAAKLRVKWQETNTQLLGLEKSQREAIAGSGKEELEFLQLTDRALRGIASGSELDRLSVIKQQRSERALLIEIEELEEKAISGKITPAEVKRLLELENQRKKLDDQTKLKEQLIKQAEDQKKAEGTVTTELEKQAAEEKKIADAKAAAEKARQFEGEGSALGLRGLSSTSTDSLQAMLKQVNEQITNGKLEWQQKGYGGVGGSTFENTNYYLYSQLDSLKQELGRRTALLDANTKGGRSATLQEYIRNGGDPLSFDQVYSQISNWAQGQAETNQQLGKISGTLSNIQGHVGALTTG